MTFWADWDVDLGSTMRFGALFNVTHWNARAMGKQSLPLPLLLQGNLSESLRTEWVSVNDVKW